MILPADEIIRHSREALGRLGRLIHRLPIDCMIEALRISHHGDYGQSMAQARNLLRETSEDVEPDQQTLHQFIDALSDLHTSVMDYFHQLYHKPYRCVEPTRLIGTDGLVLRVYP